MTKPPSSRVAGSNLGVLRNTKSTVKTSRSDTRERLEHDILEGAKRLFAVRGFGGVSLDAIATEVGTAKQNVLYYFASKENLYKRVLHSVLDVWLSYMAAIVDHADDPELALRAYIAGKLRFSREHPNDSRVYANEVIAGAPMFAQEIKDRVLPALNADITIFNQWARQGKCRAVDARHLMVVLWASTQAYADFASQISLVLGKPKLQVADYKVAEDLIVDMVLRTVMIELKSAD